ncbi:tryptophan--tRNA ligase [Micromonospora inyonensis]|uniref:Tryptophan--tRNA ligase n=1 Tax=Micromonospora inyonensis TaxID=47866 RepID=A0A1C6RDI1_9ACTN|nr:tryptophan--tRNA ligase [Micromonospora inyonensis]SCL15216.1 tryptophanyl-tRNA synthetase [Micromonospora inyonensis]
MSAARMLTGDRPTGRLHLGHYVGSIANRVRLHQRYESFFIIADLHMLTTRNTREDISRVAGNAREMVLDILAAGVEPDRATFYLQSAVPEVGDLNTLFQNLVTVPRLERVPSLKEMARDAGKEEMPYGLLGYPVLQAADILCVRAGVVPVGRDNAPHVEVTREVARRFNHLYGEVLPVPEMIHAETPVLVGTDGRAKMSKSLGNAIALSDEPAVVRRKVLGMYTDPKRVRADVPGTVEGNPVFAYHDVFNPDRAEVDELKERYRAGRVGDVEVKERLTVALNRFLDPMRERRARFAAERGLVDQLIADGTERTRQEVRQTLAEVRRAMGLTAAYQQIRRRAERSRRKADAPATVGTGGA